MSRSGLGGAIILGQLMNAKQIVGCVLVFSAIIIYQVDFPKRASAS